MLNFRKCCNLALLEKEANIAKTSQVYPSDMVSELDPIEFDTIAYRDLYVKTISTGG